MDEWAGGVGDSDGLLNAFISSFCIWTQGCLAMMWCMVGWGKDAAHDCDCLEMDFVVLSLQLCMDEIYIYVFVSDILVCGNEMG